MLKGALVFAVLAVLGLGSIWGSPRQGLAFGSAATVREVASPPEEGVGLELHHTLRSDYILHFTALVTQNGTALPCDNVIWYYIRKDAFYLGLEPDYRGCAGEVALKEGDWDIRALYIQDTFSAEKTLSLSISE